MKSLKLLALSLALCSCGQTPEGPLIDETLAPYAGTDDGVTLPDGRFLNVVCMGEGSPTVILTAGLGDFGGWAWSHVQADMSKQTRVCAWDRPGFGLSDGSAAPQDVETTTADLEAALATGKIPGPYIMVGHSNGSFETLLFTDRHTLEVVGMVLVDPSFPGQFGPEDANAPDSDSDKHRMACAAEIRSGELRPGSEDPNGCVAYPLLIPPVLTEAMKEKVLENPLQYESQASFNRNGTRSSNLVISADRDYGAMPLIVLSAEWEPPWIFALMPAFMTDDVETGHANVARGHEALADLSSQGKVQLVANAGHYIQRDQPQVVIDAVSAVVEEARALQKVSGS